MRSEDAVPTGADSALASLRSGLEALGPLGKRLMEPLTEVERGHAAAVRRVEGLQQGNVILDSLAGIRSTDDVDQVLNRILDAALSLSGADRGMVVLSDEAHEDGFVVRASRHLGAGEMSDDDQQLSRSLVRQILARGEPVVTTNVQEDERFEAGSSLLALDIRSVMAVPVVLSGKVLGGIYLDIRFTDRQFGTEDLELLEAFSDAAAVALNLATSFDERRELHLQSILALVNAVEAADAYTAGHSVRVSYYARGTAQRLGLPEKEIEQITFAGYLHDIGKIAMTANVTANRPLTDEEWEQMKRHPIEGERILRNLPALQDMLPAVRGHHERWDGKGYPDGIAGEEIHPYARILAVADSFDAMTTDRPYRKAFELERALGEIRGGIGAQYESAAAHAFLDAFDAEELQLGHHSDAASMLFGSR